MCAQKCKDNYNSLPLIMQGISSNEDITKSGPSFPISSLGISVQSTSAKEAQQSLAESRSDPASPT